MHRYVKGNLELHVRKSASPELLLAPLLNFVLRDVVGHNESYFDLIPLLLHF